MDTFIVVAFLEKGFMVKEVGLSFEAAHDFREELLRTGQFTAVLVGARNAYFSAKDELTLLGAFREKG